MQSYTLYGLASAFLHDNEDPGKLHINCNPISMVDGQREHFEVVKDLAYKETVDLTDIEASCRAFSKFINTWKTVIERQENALTSEGHAKELAEELPIAFLAGDAAFNKLDLNALFIAFFGERFSDYSTGGRLNESDMKEFMVLLRIIEDRYRGLDEAHYRRIMAQDPDVIEAAALMDKIGSHGASRKLVEKVAAARETYLKKHRTYPLEFIEACGKLSGLLERSFYHHGRFSNSGSPVNGNPPDFTAEIKSLEQPYKNGNTSAFKRLKQIAAELGTYYGMEFTGGSKIFKIPGPKNFTKDPELQAQHPELAFFHWQDADGHMPIKRAFDMAFERANWHPSYRHINLPMGGNNPMYTDPVADMMVELFNIARGTRAWFTLDKSHDDPVYKDDHDYKARVTQLAETTHQKGLKRHAKHASRSRSRQADAPQTER